MFPALTAATAATLLLSACTADSDGGSAGTTDATATASGTGVDPETLGLSVGDCLADLGAAGEETGEESDPSESEETDTETDAETDVETDVETDAETGAESTSATSTTARPATSTTTTSGTTSGRWSASADPDEPTAELDDTVPDSTTGVTTIDCSEPHVGEVFAQEDLDNQVLFPGARMPQFTAAVCTGEAFEAYIDYPFDDSIFDVIAFAPSKESWAAGDRTVTCVVTDPAAGYIPGTLEGAGY
ncbi:hypothetical protein A606_10875 [Corynebacterium terpenotabidum Y-11]|uniref:Septum formation-related domain-containing protein n=1 Tax=Corynebacterium terpenotabidum Y-11 TaxID=1200352 RepID=S4XGV1_9CORY|nr:hypothetical protein A606_10875 [Corynebacterium terpenotabidum Y-11]